MFTVLGLFQDDVQSVFNHVHLDEIRVELLENHVQHEKEVQNLQHEQLGPFFSLRPNETAEGVENLDVSGGYFALVFNLDLLHETLEAQKHFLQF